MDDTILSFDDGKLTLRLDDAVLAESVVSGDGLDDLLRAETLLLESVADDYEVDLEPEDVEEADADAAEFGEMRQVEVFLGDLIDEGHSPDPRELAAFTQALEEGDYELALFHAERLAEDAGKLDEARRMAASQRAHMLRSRKKQTGAKRQANRARRKDYRRDPSARRKAKVYRRRFKSHIRRTRARNESLDEAGRMNLKRGVMRDRNLVNTAGVGVGSPLYKALSKKAQALGWAGRNYPKDAKIRGGLSWPFPTEAAAKKFEVFAGTAFAGEKRGAAHESGAEGTPLSPFDLALVEYAHAVSAECLDCGKDFKVATSSAEAKCPKCGSLNVDMNYGEGEMDESLDESGVSVPSVVSAWASKTGKSVEEAYTLYKKAEERTRDQYPDVKEESDRWYALKVGVFKTMMGLKGEADDDIAALVDSVDAELEEGTKVTKGAVRYGNVVVVPNAPGAVNTAAVRRRAEKAGAVEPHSASAKYDVAIAKKKTSGVAYFFPVAQRAEAFVNGMRQKTPADASVAETYDTIATIWGGDTAEAWKLRAS